MNAFAQLKTPFFVIRKEELDRGLEQLKEALKDAWGNFEIGYSYKTNALPWLIAYFRDHGCLAETVSEDEYRLAKAAGVPADRILYNGVAKSKDSFLEAVRGHARVNIDAEYEIDWLRELPGDAYGVGIRVNFDLESKCPGQTQCGADGERFGFCYENGELKRAIDRIRAAGVSVSGLHLHKSSKTRMPDVYRAIAEAAVEIAERYDLAPDYVDVGGGFFGGLADKPQFPAYFDMMSGILRKRFCPQKTKLIVEPGISLVGAPISYVTTVLDVKKTRSCTFAVTDGSRTQIDPLMTKSSYVHEIIPGGTEPRETLQRQIICGYTCMENDRLFSLNGARALRPGDRIVYRRVGAYTMCLSPLFIKWFPDVYVQEGDRIERIRERWTEESILGRFAWKETSTF